MDTARPLLRGWSHAFATWLAVAGVVALILLARGDHIKQLSLLLYGACMVLLFLVSGLYHCWRWSPTLQATWKRFDHANVFVMIAGTYTPVAINILSGWTRVATLTTSWGMALMGVALVLWNVRLPRLITTTLSLLMGWISLVIAPALVARVGWVGLAHLFTGGALYSLGALAYALRRPRLWPRVFGYHEVFHLLVIAATVAFFAFMVQEVVPLPRY
jgi:hemolysin III